MATHVYSEVTKYVNNSDTEFCWQQFVSSAVQNRQYLMKVSAGGPMVVMAINYKLAAIQALLRHFRASMKNKGAPKNQTFT